MASPFVARAPWVTDDTGPSVAQTRASGVDFGALGALVGDPGVTDVFVNGPREVWVDRGRGLEAVSHIRFSEVELRDFATRLVSAGGRHIDEAHPCVDVRIGAGIRVHAVLPPISPTGTLLSIRVPHPATLSLDDLQANGFFVTVPRATVESLVAARANLLISGAGGSGNTTWHK